MKSIPKILWAQDNENIYVTVDVRDIITNDTTFTENVIKINLSDDNNKNYLHDFELRSNIIVDECCSEINSRNLKIKLPKKEQIFWDHMLVDNQKKKFKNFVSIDWALWKDDEPDIDVPGGMQGGMPGGMQGGMPGGMQGGMPGGMQGGMPGGMDFSQMMGGMPGGMPEGMDLSQMMGGMPGGGMPGGGMPGGGMPGGGMPGGGMPGGGMPGGGMPEGMDLSQMMGGMPGGMPEGEDAEKLIEAMGGQEKMEEMMKNMKNNEDNDDTEPENVVLDDIINEDEDQEDIILDAEAEQESIKVI